jgi:hypothetical protein
VHSIDTLALLRDIRSLKENTAYRRIMNANRAAMEHFLGVLSEMDPSDPVAIARVQSEIRVRKLMIDEYDECDSMIKNIEEQLERGKRNERGGSLTPPMED